MNLDFFLQKLVAVQRNPPGASSRREGQARENLRGPPFLPRRTRVYVHTPDDKVFTGFFEILGQRAIPFWVTNPHQSYTSVYRVYVRMPNGKGLLSMIQPLYHDININDKLHEANRFFVSLESRTFLSAFLYPYYHQPLPISNFPRVFVRMPDDNKTYVGELNYYYGHRPSWLI